MAKTARTAMDAILTAIEADYISMGTRKSYHAVGRTWGVSSGTAHRMITKGHWPSSKSIQKALRETAKKRGIVIASRERVRVELDLGIGKKDLEAIRELSAAERTEILVDRVRRK